jgi:hypothetical protein
MFCSRTILNYCFAALIVVGVYSCADIKKKVLPSFSVNIPDINLTIPPIAFVSNDEVPVGALRTRINMDSAIKANTAGTFGASAVTSVKVKKITIKLLNGNMANNLSNFEHARMRIYSHSDTASLDIADITFPQTYSDSLSVAPVNSAEISHFLKGSELGYNLFWRNRRTTTKFLKLKVSLTLSVQ